MAERGGMGEIAARVAAVRRRIERGRYAGDDPVVDLSARLDRVELVARVLAAERAGASLALGGERFNPQEDLAEAALDEAIGALRARRFAAVRVHLDDAATRAHDPALQQHVALFKALTRLLSSIVYAPLDEKPRGANLADLDEVLGGLDLLPEAERLHYRDEADRLLNLRDAAARGDAFLAAAWTLVRAQLAMGAGQDEAAILWLLHLAARHADTPAPAAGDTYLADLTTRARERLLALIGEPRDAPAVAPDGAPSRKDTNAVVHPRELFNALVAHLGAAFDHDLARGMEVFTLSEYIAPGIATEESGQRRTKRRKGKPPGA